MQKFDILRAIKYFELSIKARPEDEELMGSLSYLYEGTSQFDRAKALLEKIVESTPSVENYQRLAGVLTKMNNYREAISHYQKAYNLDSLNTSVLLGMAAAYDFLSRTDSATFFYERALQVDTGNVNLRKRLVDLYTRVDRFDDLIKLCYDVLERKPLEYEVRRNLGFALYRKGQKQEALNQFLIAAGINPQDSYALFQAARIYVDMGQFSQAEKTMKQALKASPGNIDLLTYLGFVYLDLRNYSRADATFKDAIVRGGDRGQLYYLLGVTAALKRELVSAYHYYKKAITLDRKNPKVWSGYAFLCDDLNFKDEALRAFETVIILDSANASALNYVGYTYAERGIRLEYALELINRALATEADNGYFIDSLGWVYYMMGRYEDALTALKKAVELSEDAVILEHLGDVYVKLADRAKAKESYEKALKLNPKAKQIKKKLVKLK